MLATISFVKVAMPVSTPHKNSKTIGLFAGTQHKRRVPASRSTQQRAKDQQTVIADDATSTEKNIYQWFKTYSEVVGLVEKRAFRTVDFAKFIQNSLKAAAAEVDAHSAFLTKKSYQSAMESTAGEFSGIGVSIMSKALEDEALLIIDVIQQGPADKAGVQSGDKIVEVNGDKIKGLSSDDAIEKLKGKPGTEVKIKIVRNKKPLEIKVIRDMVKDQNSLCYYFKAQNIYYLSLKMFTEDAAGQIATLLHKANEGKCKGLVLDLRRNPGGTLQSAIEMAGLFLEKQSLVTVTKDRNRAVVEKYFTSSSPLLKTDVPIFILIDNFTASAAEIIAGALRYHSIQGGKDKKNSNLQVFLVGINTFGKGSVQEVMPISNGCALKLTTMLYYLPGDHSIQATGIEPDFLVKPKILPVEEMRWISEMYGKESSLKRHITVLEATGKPAPEDKKAATTDAPSATGADDDDDQALAKVPEKAKNMEERIKEELGGDVQVQAAINMINLLDFARRCDPKIVNTRQKAYQFLKQQYITDDKIEVVQVK